jgi:hypothetical protein
MIRGTTPTFQLKINDETVDLTNSDNVYVTFAYMGWSLTKTGEDIDVSAQQVDVYLSQEETLSFPKGNIDVQINWTFDDGKRACTTIATVKVTKNLIERVLE